MSQGLNQQLEKHLEQHSDKSQLTSERPSSAPKISTYKPPTPPVGIPLSKILTNSFPLPLAEAYRQWSNRAKLEEAESKVLSFLPFYPSPDSTRSAQSLKVDIGNGLYINEFEVSQHAYNTRYQSNNSHSSPHPNELVVLHGYGAGLGFFYRNFDALSSRKGWRVHALDLLGYGLSSRPDFKVLAEDSYEKIRETEAFFIDSLEKWRIARNLEKFTVVAHSMGGYLASSYATKYPNRVQKLVLVSPAGVPRSSNSIEALKAAATGNVNPSDKKVPAWFNFLWERHVSPFSLVRLTGPLGPKFVSAWTSRRFANLPEAEAQALHHYAYVIFNAKGSGEYALNYLLAPGASARWPLADRAHEIPCETEWIYGANDWMDVNGGVQAIDNIKQNHIHPLKKMPDLHIVENAGHHIYLDNSAHFNDLVLQTMKQVEAEN